MADLLLSVFVLENVNADKYQRRGVEANQQEKNIKLLRMWMLNLECAYSYLLCTVPYHGGGRIK